MVGVCRGRATKHARVKHEALLLWEAIGASLLMLAPWTFSMMVG